MTKIKFPENTELLKNLEAGDVKLIAKATGRTYGLVRKVFTGQRRLTPKIKRAYEIVVEMNAALEEALKVAISDIPEIYNKRHEVKKVVK